MASNHPIVAYTAESTLSTAQTSDLAITTSCQSNVDRRAHVRFLSSAFESNDLHAMGEDTQAGSLPLSSRELATHVGRTATFWGL